MPDQPIRVLQVVGDGETGGINSFLLALAGAIDRSRFDVEVCNFGAEGAGLSELRELGINVFSMSEKSPLSPSAIFGYFRRLRSGRYDIVHAHVGARVPRVVARLAGCRTVSHVHGHPEPMMGEGRQVRQNVRKAFNIAFGVGSDVIVACSRSVSHSLSTLCPSLGPRVRTIRNGILLARWPSIERAEWRQRRESAGISAQAIVIGFIGRMVPVKRIDCIAEAARQVLPKYRDVQFVLLGDGPLRPSLERETAALGDGFRFLGTRPVAQWLPMLDVLLLPSESEGLPYSILEAMACGLPVIASSVGGIPEAVLDDKTGILIPPGDSAALASAIGRLIDDPDRRREFGVEARARAASHFDARIMARKFEDLYTELGRASAQA